MIEEKKSLDTLVQEKLDADTDFQTSLEDLSDDDRGKAIHTKRSEIKEQEYNALSEKADKAEKIAKNQEIRAKKAEGKAKTPAENITPENTNGYSLQDIRALGKVEDEDVERVEKFAKSEGISIAEAMKDSDLKAILSNRAEIRKTAEASNTGGSKRGSNKVTGERLIEDFEKGKVPETEADITKLAEARIAQKKAISKANK